MCRRPWAASSPGCSPRARRSAISVPAKSPTPCCRSCRRGCGRRLITISPEGGRRTRNKETRRQGEGKRDGPVWPTSYHRRFVQEAMGVLVGAGRGLARRVGRAILCVDQVDRQPFEHGNPSATQIILRSSSVVISQRGLTFFVRLIFELSSLSSHVCLRHLFANSPCNDGLSDRPQIRRIESWQTCLRRRSFAGGPRAVDEQAVLEGLRTLRPRRIAKVSFQACQHLFDVGAQNDSIGRLPEEGGEGRDPT